MRKAQDGTLAAVFSMIAATVGFGIIPIFLKHFALSLDAWTVNGVRYSAGALFWLPFLLVLDRDGAQPAASDRTRNVWRDAIVPSVINVIGQAAFGVSAYFVPASTMGFVLRLSFLFTIIFGFAVIAEERQLSRKAAFWLGAIVSVAGMLVMFAEELHGGVGSKVGLAIIAVTAVAWGGYSVSVRHYMAGYAARQSFGVISLYTSAALVVLMLMFGRVRDLAGISLGLWFNLMLSALIGIAFGHVLYYRAIHRLGPVVASGMALVTPFVTYLAALIVLDERLSGMEWFGGCLVVVGGALLVVARAQIDLGPRSARPSVDDYPGD